MKISIKAIDIIIIIFALCTVVFSFYTAFIKPEDKAYILIQNDNSEWIFNINAEETVSVTGPIGSTIVRMGGGCAWVESSPCVNKNCVTTGFLRKHGQWAACLPNKVLVIIKSSTNNNGEVDAVAQ